MQLVQEKEDAHTLVQKAKPEFNQNFTHFQTFMHWKLDLRIDQKREIIHVKSFTLTKTEEKTRNILLPSFYSTTIIIIQQHYLWLPLCFFFLSFFWVSSFGFWKSTVFTSSLLCYCQSVPRAILGVPQSKDGLNAPPQYADRKSIIMCRFNRLDK